MNHIGTHDTPRALNRLVNEEESSARVNVQLDSDRLAMAYRRLKLCAALQFTLPGNPCVYYGDEAGLQGAMDPFNRACYPWGAENEELLKYYRMLGALRKKYKSLAGGAFRLISAALGCVAYQRAGEPSLLVIANANPHAITYRLPGGFAGCRALFGGEADGCEVCVEGETACVLEV